MTQLRSPAPSSSPFPPLAFQSSYLLLQKSPSPSLCASLPSCCQPERAVFFFLSTSSLRPRSGGKHCRWKRLTTLSLLLSQTRAAPGRTGRETEKKNNAHPSVAGGYRTSAGCCPVVTLGFPCHLLCAAILSRLLWSAAARMHKHTYAVESASSHLHQFPAAPSEPNWLLSAPRPCCPIWPSAPPMSFPDPRWHIRSCRLMALRSMAQIACCTSAPLFLSLSVSLSHQQRNLLLACFERFTKFSWRKCFILRKNSRQ